jgi:plasmid stabilization system protein ParE
VDVLFTPSARTQLLDLVAALRDTDRDRAKRLVDAVEVRLEALADGAESGRTIGLAGVQQRGGDSIRLFYWIRANSLWVLALFAPQVFTS